MRGSVTIARVKGIPIRVHFTFGLILVWVAAGWVTQPGRRVAGVLYDVTFVVAIFACVTLHELGHSLVARHYGMRVRDITLLPIGGLARLEGGLTRPDQEVWMALAGPAVNVGLAVVLSGVTIPLLGWRAFGGIDQLLYRLNSPGPEKLLVNLLSANIGLTLFNLLPAFPMDGGRVVRALLAARLGQTRATQIAARLGQFVALLIGLIGILGGGINLLLIALFVWGGAEQERRTAQLRAVMARMPATSALLRGGVTLSPGDPLARALDAQSLSGQTDFAVWGQDGLIGVLTRDDMSAALRQRGADVPVGEVMRTQFPTAEAGGTLLDLERVLERSGSPVASLNDGGRFVGLATVESVHRAWRAFLRWGPQRV